MPTRLMVWNIQKFSRKKISNEKGDDLLTLATNVSIANGNLYHILGNIKESDIFGLIELQSDKGILGTLTGGKGAQATLLLLAWLRENDDRDWCVVPPVKMVGLNEAGDKSNYTEAVAVFYRSDKVRFVGPWVWPKNGFRAMPYEEGMKLGTYPHPWDDALPTDDDNYFAGQYMFHRKDYPTIESTFTEGNNRRPFLTEFVELDGARRHLQIVWVHPSPNNDRGAAVSRLGWIDEIKPNGKQKVVVLAGDFNIDLMDPEKNFWDAYRFLILEDKFRPNIGTGMGPTRTLPVSQATLTTYLINESLDNIFVRYEGGLQPPTPYAAVINRVTGIQGFPSDMLFKLNDYGNKFNTEESRLKVFRDTLNYGHIGPTPGTSDHLALVTDI